MFDTGSPTFSALSPADLAGAKQARAIGKTRTGVGSGGRSLGGQAPSQTQLQVELKKLSVGQLEFGRVAAIRRDGAPSLLGARLLERFMVTFDAGAGDAYFLKYEDGLFAQADFGFSPAFGDEITVAMVWDDSSAAQAGLKPGLHLTAINGVPTEASSDGIQRVIEAMEGTTIALEWEGGSAQLKRDPHWLQDRKISRN